MKLKSQVGKIWQALLCWLLLQVFSQMLPGRPNIIFIMADDLGYGDIGAFGGEKIATPHMDQLARQGTKFTQFYAGSPVCASARCVLMTGLHTGHARIRSNSPMAGGKPEVFGEGSMRLSLTGSEPTVASVLKEGGYATGISGKWGIGEPDSEATPNQMGFDEWLGYLNQNHAVYYYTDFLWRNGEKLEIPENKSGKSAIYSNDLMRDFALEFIRDNHSRPFFLYLPFTIPHDNMEVPHQGAYMDKPWSEETRIYAAMVSRLDGYVGEINQQLDELGLAENTVVFFTSDNGAVGNERTNFLNSAAGMRGRKGTVYEGGIRVPLIVKWPGKIKAGVVDATPWMFVDVFPTLADLAGVSAPEALDGLSILPTLLGKEQKLTNRLLYWEFPRQRLWQAGRVGNWKGIRYGMDGPLELYDLLNDPGESTDQSAKHPEMVEEFQQRLKAAHQPSPHWPVD